ncbi:hypothetical protein [Xanthobacter sediminis]
MLDLFGPQPRAPHRVMMNAIDAGQAPGTMPGWRTSKGAHFQCRRCGHDAGYSSGGSMTATLCPFCGAYSPRSCELLEETGGICPWEESEPDPDLLRDDAHERARLAKEHLDD